MFGIGFPELLVILVVCLLIFGPGKLPEVGQALGKSIRDFQRALKQPPESSGTPAECSPQEPDKLDKNEAGRNKNNSDKSSSSTRASVSNKSEDA